RYQWTLQGMKNSPAICQMFVACVLSPIQEKFPNAIIFHYMDDILICTETDSYLETVLKKTVQAIEGVGFEIATGKIQWTCPWTCLGLRISERTIVPQQLIIKDNPRTLRDLHQLCGSIIWVCPLLGITAEDLAPLFNLLQACKDLDSPRTITPEAQAAIQKVSEALSTRQAYHTDPSLPLQFVILGNTPRFHGLIFQWDPTLKDQLLFIEWVFQSHRQHKTIITPQELMAQLITKARSHLRTLVRYEISYIYLPLKSGELEALFQTNEHLQFALDTYPGQISIHLQKHKLFYEWFNLVPKSLKSRTPLKALTVFTDGSGKSHKSHTDLPGPVTEGNWRTDLLAMAVKTTLPDIFNQAKLGHQFFHQNVPALARMFKISREQARAIVGSCPYCQEFALPSMGARVNPQGLKSLQLWQTDVTHYVPFGRQKYIHVSIDTFSEAVLASAHSGEK
ncbi:POK10 protein, partial [Motacilla alba]|nr:POK10 protein [Motacilla alba]